jgi:5'-nucleotidase
MSLILVTNDDGIKSPGLRAAVEAVLPLGDVIVVAPSSQQTPSGRSLHGDKNEAFHPVALKIGRRTVKGYHCECSPARVILHAFDVLFKDKKPDFLVSGINYGENLGTNVTISGTIGAALQGAALGIPGLAMALQTGIENHRRHVHLDWNTARHFCRIFASFMLKTKPPPDVDILNVVVPAVATTNTPWRVTRLSRQNYFVNRMATPTLASRIGDAVCQYGYDTTTLEIDSDILAICNGLVSVTPVSMDLTSRVELKTFLKGAKAG